MIQKIPAGERINSTVVAEFDVFAADPTASKLRRQHDDSSPLTGSGKGSGAAFNDDSVLRTELMSGVELILQTLSSSAGIDIATGREFAHFPP